MRGATPFGAALFLCPNISIHAPRAGSDRCRQARRLSAMYNFNPRSPCGERPAALSAATAEGVFQSTLPVRGATKVSSDCRPELLFQSTLPVRGATQILQRQNVVDAISIHAPRAGSDSVILLINSSKAHFNPRSPCGERLALQNLVYVLRYFNPRSPCGERRPDFWHLCGWLGISIHAPRAGSDLSTCACSAPRSTDFNPRSPCGERQIPIHFMG